RQVDPDAHPGRPRPPPPSAPSRHPPRLLLRVSPDRHPYILASGEGWRLRRIAILRRTGSATTAMSLPAALASADPAVRDARTTVAFSSPGLRRKRHERPPGGIRATCPGSQDPRCRRRRAPAG